MAEKTNQPDVDPYVVARSVEEDSDFRLPPPISVLTAVCMANALAVCIGFFWISSLFQFRARWVMVVFAEAAFLGTIVGGPGVARRLLMLSISTCLMFVVLVITSIFVMVVLPF